jgi:hypothetical protein
VRVNLVINEDKQDPLITKFSFSILFLNQEQYLELMKDDDKTTNDANLIIDT